MGKRSDFKRVARDCYDTPFSAVLPLLDDEWKAKGKFIEPCAGAGALIKCLETAGMQCVAASDIEPRHDSIGQRDLFDITVDDVKRWGAEASSPTRRGIASSCTP